MWQAIASQSDLLNRLIHISPAIVYVSLSSGLDDNAHTLIALPSVFWLPIKLDYYVAWASWQPGCVLYGGLSLTTLFLKIYFIDGAFRVF